MLNQDVGTRQLVQQVLEGQRQNNVGIQLLNEKVDKLLAPLLIMLSETNPELAKSLGNDPLALLRFVGGVTYPSMDEDFNLASEDVVDAEYVPFSIEDEEGEQFKRSNEHVRKGIAEQARKDLDKITNVPQLPFEMYGTKGYGFDPLRDDIRFEFKRGGKVTIAKLYKRQDDGSEVLGKTAQSECMDGDDNITVIGQVIAVYRLFDLEVPEKYLTLPQDDEVKPAKKVEVKELLAKQRDAIRLGMSLEEAEILLALLENIRVSDTGEGAAHTNHVNSIIYQMRNNLERTIYRSGLKEAKRSARPLPVL